MTVVADHPTIRFTPHARKRCREMGLTTKQIKHAMRDPESTYPGPPEHGVGVLVSVCGEYAVAHKDGWVLTILWNGLESREAGQ